MKRIAVVVALAGLASSTDIALAQSAPPRGDVAHGRTIFAAYGCWQCHGYQGQGGNAGPKLAPSPLPFEAVDNQLRKPRDRMPVYTHATTSDQDVADIYAYLQSIPKAKTVAEIPLLGASK